VKRSNHSIVLSFVLSALGVAVSAGLLAGCASLGGLAGGIRKPQARIVKTEIEALSFEGASLRFDVEITNPNPVGIQLSGFDYELSVEGTPLFSGRVDRSLGVAARGRSVVPVPVELAFRQVLDTDSTVAAQDEFAYGLVTGFSFELPVLGRVRVPVATAGTLPVVRAPGLKVTALRVQSLSLSGASLLLELEVENRNGFGLALQGLEYSFSVNGQPWASGAASRALSLEAHARDRTELAFQLSFAALGRSAYQLLVGGGSLRYDLQGALELATTLPLLPRARFPLDLQGDVRVSR
jgi:LEA14-like dessication related protein